MELKATRLLSDGTLSTAFPLGRAAAGFGALAAGYVPFEKLLKPGASIEVLHAALDQDGHLEYSPTDPESFAPDPDKRYKVERISGSVTKPDGSDVVGGVRQWYAKTTTDDRVITYSLSYEDNQTGWIVETTGGRTTTPRFTFSTGASAPDIDTVGGPIESPTTYTEEAEVYAGGGITHTLTEVVTVEELSNWCQEKLDDLKSRVDEPDEMVTTNNEVDSYQKENLQVKMASLRIVWDGSGMFSALGGKVVYFEDDMAPQFSLTSGEWKLKVSDEITGNDKFYDAAGMYGDSTWWNNDFSLFSTPNNTYVAPGYAVYPNGGIGDAPPWGEQHIRWVCLDGKKRKFKIRYPGGGDDPDETEIISTQQDGYANITDYLIARPNPGDDSAILLRMAVLDDDGTEITVEYDIGADPVIFTELAPVAIQFKHRLMSRWGYRGFTILISPEDDEEQPEPLDKYYRTATISSTGLKYAAQDNPDASHFLTKKEATGEMSGSHSLTKPSEWKLESLDMNNRFSKTNSDYASPFKMDWSADGVSGSYEIKLSRNTGFIGIANPPFSGFSDQISITETEYKVKIDDPDPLPFRDYRFAWPRINTNHSSEPTTTDITGTLADPEGDPDDDDFSALQKSEWIDLGLPDAGKSWITESATDEYSCFVGD